MPYTFFMIKNFDFDGLIIFVLGAFVSGVLFFGIITIVRKSFQPKPGTEAIAPSAPQIQQKTRAKSVRELEKEYRRKQQQKIRDYRK